MSEGSSLEREKFASNDSDKIAIDWGQFDAQVVDAKNAKSLEPTDNLAVMEEKLAEYQQDPTKQDAAEILAHAIKLAKIKRPPSTAYYQ